MPGSEIKMKMSLDSSRVKAGLASMGRSIKDFSQRAATQFANVARAASIGLVAAFTMAARKAISLGSYLSDVAESTGFATEQFQVFRGALIDAGGKAESMEKAIIMMQKAVVQGSEGMMTYTRAFNRIGLSVDDLKRMKPEEQFQVIAKAISGAENQQDALASAMEIFGAKNAPRLIEVFKRLDKEGYGKMAEDIEEAYGIMTAETQKSLDRAADIIERFKQKAVIKVADLISGEANFAGIKAFGANLMAELAEAKEAFLNGMVNGFYKILGTISGTVEYIGDSLPRVFKKALNSIIADWGPRLNKIFGRGDFQPFDVEGAKTALDGIKKETTKTFSEYIKDGQDAAKAAWQFDASEQAAGWREVADTYTRIRNTNRKIAESHGKITGETNGTQGNLEKIKTLKEHELELTTAIAAGNKMEAGAIRERIKLEKRIQALLELGVGRDKKNKAERRREAEKMALKELWHAKEMERAQEDLLDAQLTGNEKLIFEEEKRLDLLESIDRIMKETGKSYDDAVRAAKQLAAIKFGPDVNQSGFVTRREQREFDKLQKQKEKARKAQIAEEKKAERERKQKMGVEERAQEAKRQNERFRDADRRLTPRQRELKKQKELEDQLEEGKKNREKAAREAWEKLGIGEDKKRKEAIDKWRKGGGQQLFDIDGRPLGPDGKPIPGAKPVPGAPGAEPPKPQKPKPPEDLIWNKFEPTLTKMEGHLKNIETALKCEE